MSSLNIAGLENFSYQHSVNNSQNTSRMNLNQQGTPSLRFGNNPKSKYTASSPRVKIASLGSFTDRIQAQSMMQEI